MNKADEITCEHTHSIEKEYISNMLGLDIEEFVAPEDKADIEPHSEQEKTQPVAVAPDPEPEANPVTAIEAIAEVTHPIEPVDTPITVVDLNAAYTKESFECQIFNIAGLNIALPTNSINQTLKKQSIIVNEKNNQNTLFAGTINFGNSEIDIINIEYLVMNGVSNNTDLITTKNTPVDIIVLQGINVGFIANDIINTQTINTTDVHWRDNNSQRLWLAGTVAQRGLALLDVTGVIHLLQDNIK